ncbi:MAG: PAS domain-containing sensor histidine kinase [bacterium]
MVYKRFRLNCIVRVLMISGTIYLLFFLLFQTQFYAATLIVFLITIYQIYALVHYVEKTNRDLTRFLDAIKHSDFSQSFTSAGLGASFDALKKAFMEVLERFRQARAEKEEHFRYLQTVVQHIGVGLIAFKSDGGVELINTAAKRLLRIPYLRNVHALERFSPLLVQTMVQMKSGEKKLIQVSEKDELLQLAIYATEFRMREQNITLVSLQNIQSELEEKEMEAWQNLIRVLTHEIMNSVTPISSLAATTNGLLENLEIVQNDKMKVKAQVDTIKDIRGALETIERRSEGLLHFVNAYRNLTKIPKPDFQVFAVQELCENVQQLLQSQLDEAEIQIDIRVMPASLRVTADPELIEQILINLIVNAIHALEKRADPHIELRARIDERSRVIIQVEDNGPGILKEVQPKIFIPFFTTKKGGSGIGLSLSKQIMRLHRGAITVNSEPNVGTVFTLRF